MNQQPGTIEINFIRLHEARGLIINAGKTAKKAKTQVIDGFVKAPQSTKTQKASLAPKHQPAAEATDSPAKVPAAATGLHHRAQKANTLMRGALKKPAANLSNRLQSLNTGSNPQRELRAKTVTKHQRVEHFGHPTPKKAGSPTIPLRGELMNRSATTPTAQAPLATKAVALPSMVTSASHQKLERLLDAALTQADAHKQAMRYSAARHFWQRPGFLGRYRGLKLGGVFLLVVLIGLFLAWQYIPTVSVKLAGARAHIAASVPAYQPAGYKVSGPVAVQSGTVVIKYTASNNGAGYDVTEQSSNLTSTSLAQTVVPLGQQVQTSQVDGNTVYIFSNDNNAAWVNNGILYAIKDHTQLNSDQIIKIVHSLN